MPPAHPDNYTQHDDQDRDNDTEDYRENIRAALVHIEAHGFESLGSDGNTVCLAGNIVERVHQEILVV